MPHPNSSVAPAVVYGNEPDLAVEEYIDVLARTTLGERRPLHNVPRMTQMLRQADLVLTARLDGRLVGIARSLTDFSNVVYLADLAVDAAVQGHGIGRTLLAQTHAAAGLHTQLVLLAAPLARSYYPHIGLQPHDSCWQILPRE
jgi:predicted N-acetyltransferase YhbS